MKETKPAAKGKGFGNKISKFFREHISEIKKITWPTWNEVIRNTAVTLVLVAIVGAFIWALDFGFDSIRNLIFNSAVK